MLEDFLRYINSKNLATKGAKILVAVSGGIDSAVLLHLFASSDYDIAIAHCNFKLRSEESDEEAKFVNTLAQKYDIPFFTTSFDTTDYAAQNNISIQIAARQLRYDWFDALVKEHHYQHVATAHHLNDAIETSVYNLIKGTGLAGLKSIPLQNDHIIRPLLFTTRAQIEEYARNHKLEWREDSTNKSDKYKRNFLRHKVIPLFRDINPSFEQTFHTNLERFRQSEQFLNFAIENTINDIVTSEAKNIWIDKQKLQQLPGFGIVLNAILEPYGFNFTQVMDIIEPHQTGKLFHSDCYQLNIDRSHYILSPLHTETPETTIHSDSVQIKTGQHILVMKKSVHDASFSIDQSKKVAQLDFDKIQFPLCVRPWHSGDKFQPLGMNGKKKLSDFMIDEKIPVNLKSGIYVLEDHLGNIIWVIGHRIDDRFKVLPGTKNVFTIKIKSNNDPVV